MADLRCLLLSPLPPGDGENGDAQYTRDLLNNPPDGVTYVPYQEALKSGEIVEDSSWRRGGQTPRSLREVGVASSRLVLNVARRMGVLLPDPVRYWRVLAHFDLVHIHCMPTHLSGNVPPIILSDSAGLYWYARLILKLSEQRVWRLLRRERILARMLNFHHPSVRPDCAERALYFVHSGIELARSAGASSVTLDVCPVGVPGRIAPRKSSGPPTIAFVANDFEVKGGLVLLEIFRRVRAEIPDAVLIVAGSPAREENVDGVQWCGRMSRRALYEHVYPRADLFLYPTTFDIAPLVVAEALAHGLPVVTTNIACMADLVADGRNGFLFETGDTEGAVTLVLRLLSDESLRVRMSVSAATGFDRDLSPQVRNQRLADAYETAARRGSINRSRSANGLGED